MIDVIIPAYNAHKTIEQTLYSIAYQSIVDKIKVYIVNDGSKKDYHEYVDFFSNFMNITELKLDQNSGPGVARQYGIDNSNSKYIVFIDSDDVFSDCFALSNLSNVIKKNNSDIGITDFIEEQSNSFILHSEDTVWLHGKIYSRKFIKKQNIKFNNTNSNEDNGFNQLLILSGASIDMEPIKTYIWKHTKNSITRKNNYEYKIGGIKGYLYNMLWAIKGAIDRKGDINKISEFAFSVLVASYHYYLQYPKYFKDNNLFYDVVNIKHIYDKYPIPQNQQITLIGNQLRISLNDETKNSLLNPFITFNNYLELIEEMKCND